MNENDNDKVIRLHPRYIREASKVMGAIPEEDQVNIVKLLWSIFLTEIRDSLEGKEEPGMFFQMAEKLFVEAGYLPESRSGCYFCDHDIDGNEQEFNLDRHVCLYCMVKVANVLTAFDIDHQVLFPSMGDRTVQRTRFEVKGGR